MTSSAKPFKLYRILGYAISISLLIILIYKIIPEMIDLLNEPPEGDEVILAFVFLMITLFSLCSIGLFWQNKATFKSKWIFWIQLLLVPIAGIIVSLLFVGSWILLFSSILAFYSFTKWIHKHRDKLYEQVYLSSFLTLCANITLIDQFNL